MAELGDTTDPRALIPGDPAAIRDNMTAIHGRGDTMTRIGDELRRIDTGDAWTGEAADTFRDVLTEQPRRWLVAGDAFTSTADALSRYADTLDWARAQATDAIRVWADAEAQSAAARAAHDPATGHLDDPGDHGRAHAHTILDNARRQVRESGDDAARTITAATSPAPTEPSVWTNIANWRTELGQGVRETGQELIDLANRIDPTRLLTDPAGVVDDALDVAIAATHPADIGAQIGYGLIDDLRTWTTNPARALGHDLPDIALSGAGFLGKHLGTEAVEDTAEAAARRADLGSPLTAADRAALADYTGPGFREINPALRSGTVDGPMQARIDAVNTALDKLPDYQGTVFRGTNLSPDILDTYQPGAVVADEAFLSTTMTRDRVFHGNVEFEITSRTGKDVGGYSLFPRQDEVLFRPDTRFEVLDRTYDAATGKIHILMREARP